MAKIFLRSGNLETLFALGENGQPVYALALQIRETLRLRNQQNIAACLAIPQPNEAGNRLDWYAPIHGKVTSWIAASDGEKTLAINQLEACRNSIDLLIRQSIAAENATVQRFAALLSNILQFPDNNYVYLVNGKPVITFWGFVALDNTARHDALERLRDSVQAAPAQLSGTDAPLAGDAEEKNAPMRQVIMAEATPQATAPRVAWSRLWLVCPMAIAAVVAVAVALHSSEPVNSTARLSASQSAPVTPRPAAVIPGAVSLPVAPATLAQEPKPETPLAAGSAKAAPVAATAVSEMAPASGDSDELVMPPAAVRIGSTAFLNGNWRVTLAIATLPTGKPPSLKYRIHAGKGSASILQADGISCKADITSGLMRSGNLVINSRYRARCSDGSGYKMPEIVCKATATAASCEAHYGETIFPMTIKREGK